MENPYGSCSKCGADLAPVYFTEEEYRIEPITHIQYKTGRSRRAVDYLLCDCCGNTEAVDDSFDGLWV